MMGSGLQEWMVLISRTVDGHTYAIIILGIATVANSIGLILLKLKGRT